MNMLLMSLEERRRGMVASMTSHISHFCQVKCEAHRSKSPFLSVTISDVESFAYLEVKFNKVSFSLTRITSIVPIRLSSN